MSTTLELAVVKRNKTEQAAKETLGEILTLTGLDLDKIDPTAVSFAEYEAIGRILGSIRDQTAWAMGDWLVWGEGLFGEKMAQAVEATGRAKSTLEDYARVATYVAPSVRDKRLTFHHHRIVCRRGLDADAQREWLQRAVENRWSVEEMRGHVGAINGNGSQETLAVTDGSGPVHVDEERVVQVAVRIARTANALGDGGYRVDGELISQLRAAAGLD